MQKIIYIANTRMPTEMAHGLQIMKMCEAFVKNGVELELIIPKRFKISDLGDPFKYYKVEKIFKIKKIFCFDLTPLNRFLGPISFLIQSLSFSFFVSIYLLFKKTDIIYSRDRFGLFFRKNIIFEMHKFYKSTPVSILKKIKKIVVISRGLKKDLDKKGIKNILVAPDGVDLKDFDVKADRKKLKLPLDKKLVLYTGHLYNWKGVKTLALASKYIDGLVVFIGGIKWYLSDFKKFVKKESLNVLILGHKDYSLIPFYLSCSDCLVLTGTLKSAVSKKYTSPMKMFEYMASKRPIVASNLDSFKEILNDKNSILVESDNEKALASGINKVLNNKNLAENISSQAYLDVQKYSWDNRAKKILDFICVE